MRRSQLANNRMIRYGKPSAPLLRLKQGFFDDNETLLEEGRRICDIYAAQPPRAQCKNCEFPLEEAGFVKQGVGYAICRRCGHLNGCNEDTDAFCEAVYTADGGARYGASYGAADIDAYDKRMRDIYLPKAEFLQAGLQDASLDPATLSYADLGAGSGYFVAAMRELGLANVVGFEASEHQAAFANQMIGGDYVRHHRLDRIVDIAATAEADVISMIGVLEHVQQPRQVLQALQSNPSLKYLFFSVPLFSPCVYFEAVFPSVMNRQLSAGHTHLYSESSIDWMCREFGFEREAEWWFGTDMVDLFRSVAVRLVQEEETAGIADGWAAIFAPTIDSMQMVLDKKHLSSEVHMLLRVIR